MFSVTFQYREGRSKRFRLPRKEVRAMVRCIKCGKVVNVPDSAYPVECFDCRFKAFVKYVEECGS